MDTLVKILRTIQDQMTMEFNSLYCLGVKYFSEYAGRCSLKKIIYSSISCLINSLFVMWKSENNSTLIQPFIDSIAALSVGVPALDIECTILYSGSRSLKALDEYTEP